MKEKPTFLPLMSYLWEKVESNFSEQGEENEGKKCLSDCCQKETKTIKSWYSDFQFENYKKLTRIIFLNAKVMRKNKLFVE